MGEYCPVEMSFIDGMTDCCKGENFCTGIADEHYDNSHEGELKPDPEEFEFIVFVLIASSVLFVLIMSVIYIGVKKREKATKYDPEQMSLEESSELID